MMSSNTKDMVATIITHGKEQTQQDHDMDPPHDHETITPSHTPAPSTTSDTHPQGAFKFPASRIRRLLKLDPAVPTVSTAALNHVSTAAELFCEHLARQADLLATREKRKTVLYRDVSRVVGREERMRVFLGEVVPEQIAFGEALAVQQQLRQKQIADVDEPMGSGDHHGTTTGSTDQLDQHGSTGKLNGDQLPGIQDLLAEGGGDL